MQGFGGLPQSWLFASVLFVLASTKNTHRCVLVFSYQSKQEAYLLFVQRANVVIIAVVVCFAN